jgi:hypothetical protein
MTALSSGTGIPRRLASLSSPSPLTSPSTSSLRGPPPSPSPPSLSLVTCRSLGDAKERMRNYCEQLKKPFHARYNPLTSTVWVDRAVKCRL